MITIENARKRYLIIPTIIVSNWRKSSAGQVDVGGEFDMDAGGPVGCGVCRVGEYIKIVDILDEVGVFRRAVRVGADS
ncbi:MAG: hypothetical protein ACYSSK_10585 [Planctomycetota bacterium]|jgi:hypothetical protein